jgi:2-dehydropantoate 2-reductase
MKQQDLKIAIIGAGPSGGILGAFLSQKNPDIILVDVWKTHIEAIKSNGLEILGKNKLNGKFKPENLLTNSKRLKDLKPNVVFVAVKTTFLRDVLNELKDVLEPDAFIISYQNGIETENEVANYFDKQHALRVVINYAGNIKSPGKINMTFFNPPNYIGILSPESENIARLIAKVMTEAGLKTEFSEDIQVKVWQKAILNSTLSGVCAITQMTMKEAMSFKETYHIVSNVLKECIHVANANNIHVPQEFHEQALTYLQKGGNHKPSMLIDIENHRQTEVQYLNAKIVEYAKKKKLKIPFNQALSSFITGLDFINKNISDYIKIKVKEFDFKERCLFCSYVKDCIDVFTFCPLSGDNIPVKALSQRTGVLPYTHIKYTEKERIATIQIDSPPANQLSLDCFNEILRAVHDIQWKKNADVLILTGTKKFFGSGLDLKQINDEIIRSVGIASRNTINAIENLQIPTIAMINGYALGGGLELALATDIRIASSNAKFGQPEVKIGIIPGAGGTQRLTHLIGSAKASEMILTGDIINAQQALDWGIISQIYLPEELMEAGLTLAKKIQQNAPIAIKNAKSAIRIATRVKDLQAGLDFETQMFNDSFNTKDRVEGIQAFLEKRPAKFQGK